MVNYDQQIRRREAIVTHISGQLRRILYVICLVSAVTIVLYTAWKDCQPSPELSYTSIHSACTIPPLWGFSAESLVNMGDAKALDALPGVGEVIAERIIQMRESLNGFRLPEDLMLVKGIGEKTFQKIMDALQEPLIRLPE